MSGRDISSTRDYWTVFRDWITDLFKRLSIAYFHDNDSHGDTTNILNLCFLVHWYWSPGQGLALWWTTLLAKSWYTRERPLLSACHLPYPGQLFSPLAHLLASITFLLGFECRVHVLWHPRFLRMRRRSSHHQAHYLQSLPRPNQIPAELLDLKSHQFMSID